MRLTNLPLILAFVCSSSLVSSQNCLPEGIHFETQEDIDNFPINYPGCTVIEGDVCIGHCGFSGSSNIDNLSALSQLTKIQGKLTVGGNPALINLNGLHNITRLGNDVAIRGNQSLNSLDALQQVEHFNGGIAFYYNPAIVSIDGFELVDTVVGEIKMQLMFGLTSFTAFANLRYLGGISMFQCDELVEIPNMVNLEYFGSLTLQFNRKLTELPAFPLLSVIGGNFFIEDNEKLTGVIGYENITRINGSVILGKQYLEIRDKELWNINAFHNLTFIGGDFHIWRSNTLVAVDGFTQLDSIGGGFSLDFYSVEVEHNFPQHNRFSYIGDDIHLTAVDSLYDLLFLSELDSLPGLHLSYFDNLESFEGITQFTEIGGPLSLTSLKVHSLSELSNLTFIDGNLRISDCDSLNDLSGLEGLNAINGGLFITRNQNITNLNDIANIDPQSIEFEYTEVVLTENSLLTDCNVQSICEALRIYEKTYDIKENGPGCNDISEILCFEYGLSGIIYYDENQNKIQDPGEHGIRNRHVNVDGGSTIVNTSNAGQFLFLADEGSQHTMSLVLPDEWFLTTDSSSYTKVFNEGSPTNTGNDFGIHPLVPFNDLEVNLSSYATRCNSSIRFFLNFLNTGTEETEGKIVVTYDADTDFSNAMPPLTSHDITNHKLIWQFDALQAFEERDLMIRFNMPDENFAGEYVDFLVEGLVDSSGTEVLRDSFAYSSEIVCAIDPNDKMVTPPGINDENYTLKDIPLTYTVRFENEGNADAIDITIVDTIDGAFDMTTFKVLNSSFPVFTTISDQVITFFFRNIWLKPTQTSFVTYEVTPSSDVPELTLVENTAGIIFDLNDAIITNTTFNTLVEEFCQDVITVIDTTICTGTSFLGYTETGDYSESIPIGLFCDSLLEIHLTVATEAVFIDTSICEGENFDGYEESGIYFYDSTNAITGCEIEVQLLLTIIPMGTGGCITGTSDAGENHFKIYPNPVSKELFVESEKPIESLLLFNPDGRKVDVQQISDDGNKTRIKLTENIGDGFYILVIRQGGQDYFEKIVVGR